MEAPKETCNEQHDHELVQLHDIGTQLYIVFTVTVGVTAALINAAILIAFLVQKFRRHVHLSPTGLVVLNLLFADTFYGILMITDHITESRDILSTYPYWCSVVVGLFYLTGFGSYTALINVVIDRFIAIRYTLKYREYITAKRILAMVCTGWLIPIGGLVGVVAAFGSYNDWRPELVLCTDLLTVKMFILFVMMPSHFAANLCVLVIQCRIYIILRRQDSHTVSDGTIPGMLSDKSGRILYRIIIPMCFLALSYDLVLLVTLGWFNSVNVYLFRITVLVVQISFLLNIFLYSFATANIRNPVCDLCADFRRMIKPAARSSTSSRAEMPAPGP